MGFYGNITNAATTQFQFDKIYANRYSMEQNIVQDAIYAGRFVLVEYDGTHPDGDYLRVYADENRENFYGDAQGTVPLILIQKGNQISNGVELYQLVRIRNINDYNDTWEFFKCVGAINSSGQFDQYGYGDTAVFVRVTENNNSSAYITNFNIDYSYYGNEAVSWRGYDSTVWQKIYSEEGEKYVMVAELNSIVPSFFMSEYADAPTDVPVPPHFDTMSTSTAYLLHAQPQWGFRVAAADAPEWSDESTTWNVYDGYYYKDKTKTQKTKDAAIFFNRAGFDVAETHRIDTENSGEYATDVIKMAGTGISGQYYNYHDDNLVITGAGPQIDTQELTIHLPSLGNAISDIWDLVYGGLEINGGPKRNQDIEWDSLKGLRMIERGANGYELNKKNIATLAGCINSVHDLMGMIIEEKIPTVDVASKNKIYYNVPSHDNQFCIKNLNYTWGDDVVGNNFDDIDRYSPIGLTQYSKNNYFLQVGRNYYVSNEDSLSLEQSYQQLEKVLVGYKDPLTKEPTGYFAYVYYPSFFYHKVANSINNQETDYVLASGSRYDSTVTHYDVDANRMPVTVADKTYIFKPGEYYKLVEDFGTASTSDDLYEQILEYDSNLTYYRAIYKGTTQTPTGTQNRYEYVQIQVLPFEVGKYYYYDSTNKRYNAVIENSSIREDIQYYTLSPTEFAAGTPMYEQSVYYYEDEDGNYIIDTNEVYTDDRQYFNVEVLVDGIIFYEPNKYWYNTDNTDTYAKDLTWVLDESNTITVNRNYFTKNGIYVKSDTNGFFAEWTPWNENVKDVPDSVTLAVRKESWGWKELSGFADTLTTIHGLFITINRLLQTDNKATRDLHTVQGCINTMNDIINKIAELIPGEVMIVDEYGRMHSAPVTDDNWIQVTITTDYDNTGINIQHEFHEGQITTSTTDLNNPAKDTIDLYTPQVDEKGHVIGKNTETVTLPYGFKTITTNGVGSNTSNMTTSTSNVVADNTQDTLGLNSDNKWIRIANNASADTITLAHEIHGITTTAKTTTDLNNVTEFTVQDTAYDIAGHVTNNQSHTYQLPYNFKTIVVEEESDATANVSAAAGSVIADTPVDTVTFTPGNKWINLTADASNDKITFSHEVNTITTTAKTDTDLETVSSFTVQDLTFDKAGHVTANQSHKYSMPNNFKTISVYGNSTSTSATNIEADSTADTLTMAPGDVWFELNASASDDKISFYHKNASTATTTTGQAAAASPQFGETFKVLHIGYDDKGHINNSNAYDITLPKVTITNGTGNVVTGLTIDSTTGIITESKNNIANLALTDYVAPAQVYTTITAEDTLKSALSKIETTLYNFNLNFTELDLDIASLRSKDEEFAQNFTNLDMQLELMEMKDTNLGNRITVLENTINDVENADGSITTGLSSQVNKLQETVSNIETSSGSWTPVFNGGGTAYASVSQGSYVKTGNQVIINFYIEVTGQLGDSSDMIYISGLPFAPDFSSVQSYSGGGHLSGFFPDVGGATFAGFAIESWSESGIYPVSTYIYDAENDNYITNSGHYIQGNTTGGIMSGTIMYTTV